MSAEARTLRPSLPKPPLELNPPHLRPPNSAKMLHLEISQDLGPILGHLLQGVRLKFPSVLTFVNKSTPLFVPRHATAMEDCLHALKGWMADGTTGKPTLVPVVDMEAALTLSMVAPLIAQRMMSVADSMNVSAIVIVTSPCDLQLMISCVVLVMPAEAVRTAGLWIAQDACVDLAPGLGPHLAPAIPSMDAMPLREVS